MLYPPRNTLVGFINQRFTGGLPTLFADVPIQMRGRYTVLPKVSGLPDGYGPGGAIILPYTAGRGVAWVGNEAISSGAASGAIGQNGAGTGTAAGAGVATGTAVFNGSATGAGVASGAATGVAVATGSATGSATSTGTASGLASIAGAATGSGTATGTASGSSVATGAASGAAVATGTASGFITFNGAASGAAVGSGVAAGVAVAERSGAGAAVGSGAVIGGFATVIGQASGGAVSIGTALPRAIAWGSASNVSEQLTPETVAAAVWAALASSNNTPGTMGDLLNAAGGGGISGAVIDQIADAVWDWADTVVPGSKGEELAKALKAAKLAVALSA